jgi:hypothetical protein
MTDIKSKQEESPKQNTILPSDKKDEIKVIRYKFDSLTLYEVTEPELDEIQKGSPTSLNLNFSSSLISIASSFFIALVTCNFENKLMLFLVFLAITITSFIWSVVLFSIWFRNRKDVNRVIDKIRRRNC